MGYDGFMIALKPTLDSVKSAAMRLILVGGTSLIGLVWFSIGCYGYLSRFIGPDLAGLILGALFLIPMGVALISGLSNQSQTPRMQGLSGQAQGPDHLMNIIESLKGRSPLLIASISIVTGLIATRFPQFLAVFSQALKLMIDELSKTTPTTPSNPFAGPGTTNAAYDEATMPQEPTEASGLRRKRRPKGLLSRWPFQTYKSLARLRLRIRRR